MTRARFDREQPELTMYDEGNSIRYMIAENGRQYTEKDVEGNTSKGYEYDFNEFAEPISVLEPEKVKESPSNYLGYIPTGKKENAQSSAKESTLEQRISDLEDMAAAIYGGEA